MSKILPVNQALEIWYSWWAECEYEFFKLKVLQDYPETNEGPSKEMWMNGDGWFGSEKRKAIKMLKGDDYYVGAFKDKEEMPRFDKVRFHITEEPYSEYLEWKIEAYKHINIPLKGEDVYLVSKEEIPDIELPDGDIMIFDEKRVAKSIFRKNTGDIVKMELYNEKDDIKEFLDTRDALMELADDEHNLKGV